MADIRISAAGLARIELDDKVLVGLNKTRLKSGIEVYTPFGGALEFYDSAKPFLQGLEADFEKNNDLRLVIPEDNLASFEAWFYQKKERERSPYRELKEELVDEEKVLFDLPEDVVDLEYLTIATERSITDRLGQEGKVTKRFFEVYKATFIPEYAEILRKSISIAEGNLGLVADQEILAGKSNSGIQIASNCKALIYRR